MLCGVLFESSWWACFHGSAKTYAYWVWYSLQIGELCRMMGFDTISRCLPALSCRCAACRRLRERPRGRLTAVTSTPSGNRRWKNTVWKSGPDTCRSLAITKVSYYYTFFLFLPFVLIIQPFLPILRLQEQEHFRSLELRREILEFSKKFFHFNGGILKFPLSFEEKSCFWTKNAWV